MITLQGATVSLPSPPHGRRTILDTINLNIRRGEWIALVGGNGAGKTTLLSVLASLVPLTSGELRFSDGGQAPRVGLLLQEPDNQLVTSSVLRELVLSADAGADDAVAEASRRFGLDNLWERNPHRLSGGEKQRLALATVWLQNPDIVLLDEPTTFLDEDATATCIGFVREMHAAGATIVWVSPGDLAIDDAQTVVCLDSGAVVFHGSKAEFDGWPRYQDHVFPQPPARADVTPDGGARALVFDNVSFGYGDGDVLTGLNLSVGAGECVGIAGRNGSGKTTLLLLAGGVLEPGSGTRTPAPSTGTHRAFYMPQSPERMFFAETVLEELAFGLRSLGVTGREARVRAAGALELVGLDPDMFLERQPFQLSCGEMRRVAFAIAGVMEPSLLLLDEPTAGLDPGGVALFYELLDTFRRAGTTILLASHDRRALGACDRVVSLDAVTPE